MKPERRNYFNVINLIGVALGVAGIMSVMGILVNTMSVVSTMIFTGVTIASFGIIRYDDQTDMTSQLGVFIALIFVFSLLGAAVSFVHMVSTQIGFITPEPVENPAGKSMQATVMFLVGVGLFYLGQVFEE